MKKNNSFFSCCLIVIVIITTVVAISAYYVYQQLSYRTPHDSIVNIEAGDGLATISQKLYQVAAIPSINAFNVYTYLGHNYKNFIAGQHTIPANSAMNDIINILQEIPQNEVSITIPEGQTTKDIISKISQNTNLSEEEISKAINSSQWHDYLDVSFTNNEQLEGFLFPDTYRFNKETNTDEVISKILDNFNQKWSQIKHTNHNLSDYDILILASIIEKEAASDNERAEIAGILMNRLDNGMYLGVNATINYILDKPQSFFNNNETSIDSPYNSYTNLGLPPTPICNPGLKSIEAAANPNPTDNFYYFHTPDGQVVFSQTLDEHNEQLAKYY